MKRTILALAALLVCMAGAQNMLMDAAFTPEGGTDGLPRGWLRQFGAGASCALDGAVRRAGPASLRVTAEKGAKTWNMSSHEVEGFRGDTPYTFSAWVRTKDLEPGALAYISLNCFADVHRLAANDSELKLTGTRDWTRIVCTVPKLPQGTQSVRFVFCLYGGGTAWFADPQVEAGAQATDWAVSPEETATAARRARQAREAAAWLKAKGLDAPGLPRAAVLDLGFAPGRNAFGCMSDPAAFERNLAGVCRPVRVSGDELCNPSIFCRTAFDLLVVPTGSAFPAGAADALVEFLSAGGRLLTCGGYAFDKPVVKTGGRWGSPRTGLDDIPAGTIPVALPPAAKWWTSADAATKTEVADIAGPAGAPGVRVSTPSMEKWSTAVAPLGLKGRSVVSFHAKGGPRTKAAWFELDEKDGSRWHAKLELAEDWKEFRLTPAQFTYWRDNPSVGRGGPGDHVDFDAVARVSLGVAMDVATPGDAHAVELCGLKAGDDPQRAVRCLHLPQINTRTARIRDAIHPKESQIGVFDPSFDLRDVASVEAAPDLALPGAPCGAMAATGFSALAQLGVNGHGFGPNRCTWRPLLVCRGADRGLRGWAGALVRHYAGTFAGSSWAVFGVDNVDLFAAGGRDAAEWTRALVRTLLAPAALHDTTAEYACYRAGETARLRTRVGNTGDVPFRGTVDFVLSDESGARVFERRQTVEVPARRDHLVEIPWTVPAGAPDYLRLAAVLRADGVPEPLESERGAVVVWNDGVIAKGPKLAVDGLRFTLDGASRFILGSQTFWGQHGSVTASSPAAFYDDFRQMRAFGLRATRCFLPFRTEKEKRDSDAVVQLAQKFGLALYHTPNLWNTRDAAELAKQRAAMTEIAARYRNVPGFLVDMCNEPQMREPPSRGATDAQRAWAKGNRDAFRAVRPEVPVSIGWSQGWAGGSATKDPQVASLDLDFTDRHYYGPPVKMVPELKDVDLRVLGKPLIMGECGAKNHPTFKSSDPWGMGDDDAGYDLRFRYLVSHAFGTGATALLSWHWRDPMEGIFPCGLVHAGNVPRPTAHLYAKMAKAFGRLELVDNPPDVIVLMDEEVRQHPGPARVQAVEAAHRVDAALLWWGANWSKLTSSMEPAVPSSVKLVIRPEQLPADGLREAVGRMLKEKGASFTRRAADPEALETFRVPGRGATGWVFWNGGATAVECLRDGHRLTVGPKRAGYLQVSSDGALQAREEL